ncbi:MAG: ATP-dependent DNA helicase RecG, partial [Moorellales bacterium]
MDFRDLDRPVQYLKTVGPKRAKLLARLGIYTVRDLLLCFPRRYADRRLERPLAELLPGQTGTVVVSIVGLEERRPNDRLLITRALVTDGTDQAWAIWFNQNHIGQQLRPGQSLVLVGKIEEFLGQKEILVQEYEAYEGKEGLSYGRIVPFYPLASGLSQRTMRQLVYRALNEYANHFPEMLPLELRRRYRFPDIQEALWDVHFPRSPESLRRARTRLAYEELFVFQLALLARSRGEALQSGIAHPPDGELMQRFYSSLPFSFTPGQERAWKEIKADMESHRRMARLLQGDVGSGKTVVAAAAMVKAVEGGHQAALMAPTELLAEQHAATFLRWLAPLGIRTALLTGSLSRKEREETLDRIARGEVEIIIGTHALIQEGIAFHRLGLIVIDEQHRFGVGQRARLLQKGETADLLVMTATPIPRTLALTLYGDLEVSVIDALPPGRRPVKTVYLPESRRHEAYAALRREVARGGQAYVVCPLVEDSEAIQAQAAEEMAEWLRREVFPDLRIGLVHGRLRREEREKVMESFRQGEFQVLVATTVIEVGVDVPRAN